MFTYATKTQGICEITRQQPTVNKINKLNQRYPPPKNKSLGSAATKIFTANCVQ